MVKERRARGVACALCLLLASAPPAQAQSGWEGPPGWTGHFGVVAGNALVAGGVTAVAAWLRGHRVDRSFAWGALGGTLSAAGKAVAARNPQWGGLAARQVSELGHSVALNVAQGGDPWDELWLSVGPARVRYWNRAGAPTLPIKVNLHDAVAAAEFLLRDETRLLVEESLSTGTFVFDTPGRWLSDRARGRALGSVVVMSGAGDFDRKSTLGHELVHVAQGDFLTRFVSAPLERALLRRLGWGSPRLESVEGINALSVTRGPVHELVETEAQFLDGGHE